MSDRERRFCEEYLIDLDASAAALRAGFPLEAALSAAEWLAPGSEGYRRRVHAGVQKRMAERARRTGITAERVLREYARIAFASIAEVADFTDGVRMREGISADDLAAVASVKFKGSGGDCEIKMYDKLKALDILGRHLGLPGDGGGEAAAMPRIVAGADGSMTIEGGDGDDGAEAVER